MNPLVQVDPGLFIWTILTFVVLAGLLAAFGWRPLLKFLEAREESIRKSLDNADAATRELARLQAESTEIIRSARVEAEAIVSKSRSDAEQVRDEIRGKARADAEKLIEEARRQIGIEKSQALREIRGEVAHLSIAIASKLLDRNVTTEDNERLAADTLRELEAGR
jgi:F-type H+-transporting ATPase subunit b